MLHGGKYLLCRDCRHAAVPHRCRKVFVLNAAVVLLCFSACRTEGICCGAYHNYTTTTRKYKSDEWLSYLLIDFCSCALFLLHPEGNALIKPTGLRSAAAPQRARKAGSGRLFDALLSNGYIQPTGILPLHRPPLPALATLRVAAALLMSRSFARESKRRKKAPFPLFKGKGA